MTHSYKRRLAVTEGHLTVDVDPWSVDIFHVRLMLLYVFQLLTQVLLGLLAGYCCAQWLNFKLPYCLYRIFRKSDTMLNVKLCILINNKKI